MIKSNFKSFKFALKSINMLIGSRSEEAKKTFLPHFFYSKFARASDDKVRKNRFKIVSSSNVDAEKWFIKFAYLDRKEDSNVYLSKANGSIGGMLNPGPKFPLARLGCSNFTDLMMQSAKFLSFLEHTWTDEAVHW